MASGSHHSSGSHSGSHHSSHSSSSSHHSSSHSSYSHSSYHSSSGDYRGPVHTASNYTIPRKGVLYNERDIFPGGATYDEYLKMNELANTANTTNNPGVDSSGNISALNSTSQFSNSAMQQNISPEDLIIYAPKKKKTADDEYSPVKEERLSHGASWVSGNSYCLNTKDPYFIEHYPNPGRPDPRVTLIIFGIIAFFLFGVAGSNLEYELLIRPFETMSMTDGAFAVFDNLIYYGQFVIPFIVFAVGFILYKKKHKQNEMFVRELIKYNSVEEERLHYERTHEFLAVCPQCGAPRQPGDVACQYCGTSLVRERE